MPEFKVVISDPATGKLAKDAIVVYTAQLGSVFPLIVGFLAAGAIILAQHHEQNMFKMGGLAKALPVTFWTFLIGSASLAALPLITAGFYSKDAIIWYAWSGPNGSIYLWMAAVFGAMVTAFYTFRMVFVTFFGEQKMEISHYPTWRVHIPLIALAFFALFGGFIELPGTLGHLTLFSDFMKSALPVVEGGHHEVSLEIFSQVLRQPCFCLKKHRSEVILQRASPPTLVIYKVRFIVMNQNIPCLKIAVHEIISFRFGKILNDHSKILFQSFFMEQYILKF